MESMDLEIAQVVARIERVEKSLKETTEKLTPQFDPNVSITIAGLPFQDGENVTARVKRLLFEGMHCDPVPVVVAAERLVPRGRGPGLIKVEFPTVQVKVAVLRRKQQLKEKELYSKVYVHSAKTHAERLIELNFKTILDEIPTGKNFYVTGNGRVVRREPGAPQRDRGGRRDGGGEGFVEEP